MLDFLKISNLALIDTLSIEFFGGFSCVTGETGAGKSVILGALSILAGNRCPKEAVGSYGDLCTVEASISFDDDSKVNQLLQECGLPVCEDGTLILSRSISKTKGGRIFVNGALAALASLAKLGSAWIDFHGPGEPQKLFSLKNQLSMLDAFCGEKNVFADYAQLYQEHKKILAQIKELAESKKLTADEIEFLKAQIAAIDALKISEESIVELEQSYKIAEMASDIFEKSRSIIESLSGYDSVVERLRACNRLAGDLARAGGTAQNLAERLSAAIVEIDDISSEFESLARASDMSAEEVESIRKKMSSWMGLVRKYGATPQIVLAARDDMKRKIFLQGDVKSTLEKLRFQDEEILKKIEPVANSIFSIRRNVADNIEKEVVKLLKNLGFKRPEFQITLNKESEFSANFGSFCEFNFSANAGQPARALAKIASSGELARVMLALKTVLAEADDTPVLVFDEVDANVGGEIGGEVGRQLAKLAKAHQVFCITHLPQVAARADSHFLVEKIQKKDTTRVSLADISANRELRISELARMLGDRNSESAIAHARELLGEK